MDVRARALSARMQIREATDMRTAKRATTRARRLPAATVDAIDEAKYLGVKAGAGSDHRFIGIWVVVVDGRVFARSWTVKPNGWYRAFLADPVGVVQVGERQIRVRARPVRSERLLDAIERAYAEKYNTQASRKYVRGFRTQRRRQATVEFVPR